MTVFIVNYYSLKEVDTLLPASVINRASDRPAIPAPTIALLPVNSYAVLSMCRPIRLLIIKVTVNAIEAAG